MSWLRTAWDADFLYDFHNCATVRWASVGAGMRPPTLGLGLVWAERKRPMCRVEGPFDKLRMGPFDKLMAGPPTGATMGISAGRGRSLKEISAYSISAECLVDLNN